MLCLVRAAPPPLWRVVAIEGEEEQACAFGEKTLSGRVWTQDELKRAKVEGWPLRRLAAKGREL